MKITYDKTKDLLRIVFNLDTTVSAIACVPDANVLIDVNNQPVGLDVINASTHTDLTAFGIELDGQVNPRTAKSRL